MKLRDWKLIRSIECKGYFLDEHGLPIRVTEPIIVWLTPYGIRPEWSHHFTEIRYHKHVSHHDVHLLYGEECDIIGDACWPTFAGVVHFWGFHPPAISQREAKTRALFARKYGCRAYWCRYIGKSHQRLQLSRSQYGRWDRRLNK